MKFAAAYLLACLGAEQAAAAAAATEELGAVHAVPTKDDVRRILGSVGAEVEDHRLDLLFALVDGKDVADLIAAGREQLAYAPSGAAAAAAAPGGVANAAAEAEEEEDKKKKEEDAKKEEEEDEDDVDLFSLFD